MYRHKITADKARQMLIGLHSKGGRSANMKEGELKGGDIIPMLFSLFKKRCTCPLNDI